MFDVSYNIIDMDSSIVNQVLHVYTIEDAYKMLNYFIDNEKSLYSIYITDKALGKVTEYHLEDIVAHRLRWLDKVIDELECM